MTQAALVLGALLAVCLQFATCQVSVMRWCTTSTHEEQKCMAMKTAFAANSLKTLNCVSGQSASHCMELININQADLITLDGGDVYMAGKKFNMVPVMQEVYAGNDKGYYAIAVVSRANTGFDIQSLRGKKSCHTGVRKTAGWNVPVGFLLEAGYIDPSECQHDIHAAGNFFNQSCAPGALSSTYDPNGDNPESLCALCQSTSPKCPRNSDEPYYNYAGAFRCLVEGGGDVAFIKPQTLDENIGGNSPPDWAAGLRKADFQLLCKDGTRADVGQHMSCNLAYVPSHAVMTSNNFDAAVLADFRTVLNQAQDLFKDDVNPNGFSMFDSVGYDGSDLLFKDSTESLADVTADYAGYLGEAYLDSLKGLDKCPEGSLRWCVRSAQEKEKCRNMSSAFRGASLMPPISCYQSDSSDACAIDIADDEADLVALDGGKLYKHGREGRVVPIMSEDYGSGDASYWGVAVVKRTSDFTINDLKGKKSCHTGYMRTVGWKVPIGFLLNRGDIVSDDQCLIPKAVGEFFSQSCVPGVLDPINNPSGTNPENLCELCGGQGDNKCKASNEEPYYGYAGAFKCLVDGRGDVAFVKHVTVGENPDVQKSDYQLLCPDGTRAEVDDYLNCNLAKAPSHAVVTAESKTAAQRQEMVSLLNNAQNLFKSDAGSGFKMFDSQGYGVGGSNLIFKDSTVQLDETPDSYDSFLSKEYLEDMQALYCQQDGPGTGAGLFPSLLLTLVAVAIHRLARG